MTDWFSLQTKAFSLWMDMIAAQGHAMRTIAARTAILADTSTPAKRRRASREAHAMVAEKMTALSRGAIDGGAVLARSATRGKTTPEAMAATVLAATRAAFEPARRRVAINARRLKRP